MVAREPHMTGGLAFDVTRLVSFERV